MVAGILPIPAAAMPAPEPAADGDRPHDPPAAEAGAGQRPSEAYEAWLEHAHDRIAFTPGDRVTVGFKPRADDRWTVGGAAPVALPPGRATGRSMAGQPNAGRGLSAPPKAGPRPRPSAAGDAPATSPESPVDAPSNRLAIRARAVSVAQPAAEPGVDLAATSGVRRQVFGFLPYWEVNGASSRLDYDKLSTIAYFSVGVTGHGALKKRDADGSLTTGWGGWTSSGMTRVINAAHADGTRVVLTVTAFAWTTSQARVQKALLGSRGARATLARQIVAAVRDRGADGVNLDFEPLAQGYGDEFVSLLRRIRSEFNRVRSGYQITYDTTAYIGNYPLEASVGKRAADAIFIMGYDFRIGSSSRAGSISPLSGSGYDLADTVRAYKRRVPGSRLILGIPWYGRAWSTATDNPRSRTLNGAKYGYSRAVNYENVMDYVREYGRRWDSVEQSPYVVYRRRNCTKAYGCVTSWRQVWYEDAASMKRRYALVNAYGLRGAGMWALGYEGGRRELYRALADSFRVAHAAPTAAIRRLPGTAADEGFIVRWVGRGFVPIASYDIQVSVNGGPWRTWRSNTKATSDVFLGATGGRYAFRVRARDRSGAVGGYGPSGSTTVRAGIRRLDFGAGGAATALGTSAAQLAARAFSPNHDGSEDGTPAALDECDAHGLARRAGAAAGRQAHRHADDPRPLGRWPGVDVGRARARTAAPRRPLPPAARGNRRGPDVPGAVGTAGDDGPGRALCRPHRHRAADDRVGIRHEPADLAQRRWRPRFDATVARGHGWRRALDRQGDQRRRRDRSLAGRDRSVRHVHVAGDGWTGSPGPGWAVRDHRLAPRRRRQPGEADRDGHRGYDAAQGRPQRLAAWVLAERRSPARHDDAGLDRARAGDRQHQAVQGIQAGPHVEGDERRLVEGDLGRQARGRTAGRRWDVHPQGRREGRRRQQAAWQPRPSSSTGPCVVSPGLATSPPRTATP